MRLFAILFGIGIKTFFFFLALSPPSVVFRCVLRFSILQRRISSSPHLFSPKATLNPAGEILETVEVPLLFFPGVAP